MKTIRSGPGRVGFRSSAAPHQDVGRYCSAACPDFFSIISRRAKKRHSAEVATGNPLLRKTIATLRSG